MVTTDATLLELNERAPEVKNRVKARVKDVERLKVERVAKEDELPRTQRLEEDRHWPELHAWCVPSPTLLLLGGDLTVCIDLIQRYQAAVSLHKSLMSLDKFETPSENELQLTYSLPKSRKATIALVFLPNTRKIAEARLVDSDIDIGTRRRAFSVQ